ncbi:MAG: hypothetical protein IAE90_07465 [Ignavibacteria bacterium]|nr:hypothetical protein [Ignavibacteria bacterium]
MKADQIKEAIKNKTPLFFLSNKGVTKDIPVRVVETTDENGTSALVYTANTGSTARSPEKFFESQAELGKHIAGDTE